MTDRAGEAGPVLAQFTQSVTVPAIAANAYADVACAADAKFAGGQVKGVRATFAAAPNSAALGIVGAYVSNDTTGVVTIRFSAGTGGVAGGAQSVVVQQT